MMILTYYSIDLIRDFLILQRISYVNPIT